MRALVGFLTVLIFVTQPELRSESPPTKVALRQLQVAKKNCQLVTEQTILHWEQKVAAAVDLQKRGMISAGDVDRERIMLAMLRYNLGVVTGDRELMVKQLTLSVNIRETELKRIKMQFPRTSATITELEEAQRKLANARFHLAWLQGKYTDALKQIYQFSELCKVELQRQVTLQRRNAGSEADAELARLRLAEAIYNVEITKAQRTGQLTRLLFQSFSAPVVDSGSGPLGPVAQIAVPFGIYELEGVVPLPEKAIEQLRAVVALRQKYFQREMRLFNMNAMDRDSVDEAHMYLLYKQQRLARAENKPNEVLKYLKKVVAVSEAWAARDKYIGIDEKVLRKHDLAWARHDLALAKAGIGLTMPKFGSLGDLDY